MKFEYDYVDGPEQYGHEVPAQVKARYVREETDKKLQGFPFWEALPVFPPFDPQKHTVNLEDLGAVPDWDTPDETKLDILNMLDYVRINLPFRKMIEHYIRRTLLVSYRDRADYLQVRSVPIVENDELSDQQLCFSTPLGGLVSNGVTVTGWSGCGKTTAVDETLMKLPRIIVHELNGRRMKQVVYVKLDCLANSNLRSLLDSFGSHIDELFGNTGNVYYNMIHKEKTLGGKSEAVIRLIKEFAIGLLVLDEVQMLEFDSGKESSYTSLMTIVNKTKVGLVSIGTDEAVAKLYGYWHTARRAGVNVPADEYCLDDGFVMPIIAKLFKWRFFDKQMPLTADIMKAYRDCSGGTVEKLVSLHKEVVTDYIKNGKTATVDGDYIRSVAFRKWKNLETIIEKKTKEIEDFKKEWREKADSPEALKALVAIEKRYSKRITSLDEDEDARWDRILEMVRTVLEVNGEMYSEEKILSSMNEVSRLKSYVSMEDNVAAKKVLAHLIRKGSDKRPGPKPDEQLINEFNAHGLTIRQS